MTICVAGKGLAFWQGQLQLATKVRSSYERRLHGHHGRQAQDIAAA